MKSRLKQFRFFGTSQQTIGGASFPVQVNVALETEDLAKAISENSTEDVIDLLKLLDEEMGDWYFTREVRDTFQKIIDDGDKE